MKNPASKLGILQHKFSMSGLNGNPAITDDELKSLKEQLEELSKYMNDRGDSTMRHALVLEAESVNRMIFNRKNY